jgi:hypothetical protein
MPRYVEPERCYIFAELQSLCDAGLFVVDDYPEIDSIVRAQRFQIELPIYRQLKIQNEYRAFATECKERYTSVSSQLKIRLFGFGEVIDPATNKKTATVASENSLRYADKTKRYLIRLVPNDFPYWLEDNVEHLVLWIVPHGDADAKLDFSNEEVMQIFRVRVSNSSSCSVRICTVCDRFFVLF